MSAFRAEISGEVVFVKQKDGSDFLDIGIRQEGALNGITLWAFANGRDGKPGLGQLIAVGETVTLSAYVAEKTSAKGNRYLSIQAQDLVAEKAKLRKAV